MYKSFITHAGTDRTFIYFHTLYSIIFTFHCAVLAFTLKIATSSDFEDPMIF